MFGNLPKRDPRDVAGGLTNGTSNVGRDALGLRGHLVSRDLERGRHMIEPPRERDERAIAADTHAIDDRADAAFELGIVGRVARQKPFERPRMCGV
jgi:hypothetical protein